MQPRHLSALEAITNTFAGMAVSFAIQVIIYPVMDITVTLHQNIVITAVFTAASMMRGYVVRRLFNRLRP